MGQNSTQPYRRRIADLTKHFESFASVLAERLAVHRM